MGARPTTRRQAAFSQSTPSPGGSLNSYDYAGQDPVNGYDLSGNAAGEPGDDEVPSPESTKDFAEAGSRTGFARLSMRQFFRLVKNFDGADVNSAFDIIRKYAKSAGWKWAKNESGNGYRFYDTKTNEQLRFSDEHGDWRLYAQFRYTPRRQALYGQADLTGKLTVWP